MREDNLGLPDVTRVAFAGDWHGHEDYASRAVGSLSMTSDPWPEVVLHTGDFGYRFRDEYLWRVERAAERAGLVVAFVDGNHEDFDYLEAQPVDDDGVRRLRPRVWHLPRGLRWTWSGKRFLALGGAVSVDRAGRTPGASWWPQETITRAQAQQAIEGGPADIMVCHDTVAGYDIPGLGDPSIWPEDAIRQSELHRGVLAGVVEQVRPTHLWHGHYHVPRYAREVNGCRVSGLDCNGSPLTDNLEVIDLWALP